MAQENPDLTAISFYDRVASKFDSLVNEVFYETVAGHLMDFIDLEKAGLIVEVGAGPGFSTRKIREHFPKARLTALEPARELLVRGERRLPDVTWLDQTLKQFQAEDPVDLVVSSMAYHWLSAEERQKFLGLGTVVALAIPVSGKTPVAETDQEGNGELNKVLTRLLRDLKVRTRWPREARQGELVLEEVGKRFRRVSHTELDFTESFQTHELLLDSLHSRGVLLALSDTQLKHARRTLYNLLGNRKARFRWNIKLVVGYG